MALYAANLCLLPPFLALPSLLQHHSTTLANLRDGDSGDDGDEDSRADDGSRYDASGAHVKLTNPLVNPLIVPMLEREPMAGNMIEYPRNQGKSQKKGRRVRWGDEAGLSLTAIREYEPCDGRDPDGLAWWEMVDEDDDVCACAMQ